ncbi:MAG: biotin--[acetyl-CoA-carboxylase] ligase [Myxococcales bacterium]|nr:biotin--[acetyl-CoA-carboxylase] ligase [Myxococcales bacterium]
MRFDQARLHSELAALRGAPPRHGLGAALARPLATTVVLFDQTGSTNDEAIRAARAGAEHGALFVAESQTAGRGRRGRSWSSPPGENLLFSLLLRPDLELKTASRLTLAVGLAVRDAVSEYVSQPPRIKWPNDIWVERKKLAGILVESQLSGNQLDSVIVGVGLNVLSRELAPEIAASATSLALSEPRSGAPDLSREGVLARILCEFERRLAEFEQRGLSLMLDALRANDALLGAHVRVDGQRGVARGIDQNGALVLETSEGSFLRIENGSVELD